MEIFHQLICQTVDTFGAEVILEVLSDSSEGVLSDSLQSKLMLQNIIVNNSECTGFLMWFSCYFISCIFKPTKKSKHLYCLFAYDENHQIQHTKNINGTASVVEAISKLQKKCKSPGHYKIQFLTCSCKNGDQNKRKKIIKNQIQKQNYEIMEPPKKRMLLEKLQVRQTTKRATNKTSTKLQSNGCCKETRAIEPKSRKIQNTGHHKETRVIK